MGSGNLLDQLPYIAVHVLYDCTELKRVNYKLKAETTKCHTICNHLIEENVLHTSHLNGYAISPKVTVRCHRVPVLYRFDESVQFILVFDVEMPDFFLGSLSCCGTADAEHRHDRHWTEVAQQYSLDLTRQAVPVHA